MVTLAEWVFGFALLMGVLMVGVAAAALLGPLIAFGIVYLIYRSIRRI